MNARITPVGGAPPGEDASWLAALARREAAPVLHITRIDRRLAEVAEALAFRDPDLSVLTLPAWDCQPYDRVSPRPDIAGRRAETLARLAKGVRDACVVVTTVNAALQRLPPRAHMRKGYWQARVGDRAEIDPLVQSLVWSGYTRVPSVALAGEYAVRGGILDVFSPQYDLPLRLEFAFDRLEAVRRFDPLDQRSVGEEEDAEFHLAGEVSLDPESVDRFRQSYLRNFGVPGESDPLYHAVAEGRRHQGMEHWLPLFHESLETVFDYLPKAPVVLDELVTNAIPQRQETVADLYQRRLDQAEEDQANCLPCPAGQIFVSESEFSERLEQRRAFQLATGRVPGRIDSIDLGARAGRDFAAERVQKHSDVFDALAKHLRELQAEGKGALITTFSQGARERFTLSLSRLSCDLKEVECWEEFDRACDEAPPLPCIAVWQLPAGYETDHYAVISEQDILGDRLVARAVSPRRPKDYLRNVEDLAPGDLVVHSEFGLGRFIDLETIRAGGFARDCVTIEYLGGDLLRVPVENIDLLYRYGEGDSVTLDRLGAASWQARKANAKKRIKELAEGLLQVAAQRELKHAPIVTLPETGFEEFCARFPYLETDDQLAAVDSVLTDMASGRPMDRLICGDVGFGKTEVALRAIFATAMSGGQAALLAPTTLLARQHHKLIKERFEGFPLKLGVLTRFTSTGDAKNLIKELEDGTVSIVAGTHALLARRVKFAELHLLVVDEEQQFGVEQKERLKAMRDNTHVLSMSATPIPRTLNLTLSGLRPMSVIATPPADRLAIRTYVLPFDSEVVREALLREHLRGGQSFVLVPRISDLEPLVKLLETKVPEVKVVVAHGQLPSTALEERMNGFYDGAYDVLLSTTIIASGLDIPRANTLVVIRADRFGLAQLHQIRGRVGRSKLRAYAYFTTDPRYGLTESAQRRLEVLAATEELGSGIALASRDLDIRGAGNLLGAEQAGHIREVGTELYQEMLEAEVLRQRATTGVEQAEDWSPRIEIGVPARIPDSYIADLATRLGLYRRLADKRDTQSIEGMAAEIRDRFGPPPAEVERLYAVMKVKTLCRANGIESIDIGGRGAKIGFRSSALADPDKLLNYVLSRPGDLQLRPDGTLLVKRRFERPAERTEAAIGLCREIARIMES